MSRQQNSAERKEMLEDRAREQRGRFLALRPQGVPANINRRTGEPHDRSREISRRQWQQWRSEARG